MSDENERSVASAGSQPVAWRVYAEDGSETVLLFYELARAAADEWNWSVEPLYRSPTLTEAEQLAIAWAAREADEWDEEDSPEVAAHADALRGLARRLF